MNTPTVTTQHTTQNDAGITQSGWNDIMPVQLGLMISAVSLGILTPTMGTTFSDVSLISTLVAALGIAIILVITLRIERFSKRVVWLLTFLSIHIAGISSLILGLYVAIQHTLPPAIEILLRALAIMGSALLSFYWLRKLRGTASAAVGATVYGAIGLSSIVFFAAGFLNIATPIMVFVASFLQFWLVKISRNRVVPSDTFPAIAEAYFGTTEHRFSSRGYLAAAALGICCFSLTVGMCETLPEQPIGGNAIFTRALIAAMVAIGSFVVVHISSAEDGHAPTTGVWIALQLLLALGALATSTATTAGSMVGLAFSAAATQMLQAFVWYVVVAFISFGLRDPYFYAATGWLSNTVLSMAGIVLARYLSPLQETAPALPIAILYTFMLAATQVVFTRLLRDPEAALAGRTVAQATSQQTSETAKAEPVRPNTIMDAMAVPPETQAPLPSNTPDVHIATSVIAMGQRFGLTGREIEVLTLYALGHTQARVSEELNLSTNTVHTHIKRIYDKTDLHSRQEILDYIAEYGE